MGFLLVLGSSLSAGEEVPNGEANVETTGMVLGDEELNSIIGRI